MDTLIYSSLQYLQIYVLSLSKNSNEIDGNVVSSQEDESETEDKVLCRKRKLCDNNDQQPSCKKLFQSGEQPETSDKTDYTR